MTTAKLSSLLAFGLICTLLSTAAFAEGGGQKRRKWNKNHPRQHEVLGRANREENKNNAAAVNGKLTNAQAQQLDREDQAIKAQDRAEAAANGGYITRAEKRQMNREENRVNRQRRREERHDAAAGGNGGPAPASNGGAPAGSQ